MAFRELQTVSLRGFRSGAVSLPRFASLDEKSGAWAGDRFRGPIRPEADSGFWGVPPGFWNDPNYGKFYTLTDTTNANALIEKQMTGYAYLSLRSVGDQPGRSYPRYLSSWRTLPGGAFISEAKFNYNNPLNPVPVLNIYTNSQLVCRIYGFNTNNIFPFPSENTLSADGSHWIFLPYIAFDGMGQLVSGNSSTPEYIPISEGAVSISRDPNTKVAIQGPVSVHESPPGNTTNNYNLVYIDQLTGRARIEHTKVQ